MFSIYILINPLTKDPFYVGCTRDAASRFNGHLYSSSEKTITPTPKDKYILSMGLDPVMQIIETITSNESDVSHYHHSKTAAEREAYWIEFFIAEGYRLTNVRWLKAA